jgi:aspartyl-tRNA(Asn)/glutamyl-tRNA(Gln) amidotransferase subunit A
LGLNERTLHELIALLDAGEISLREIIGDLYATIEERDASLRAYLELADKEELLMQAESVADRPLRGLPIAIKDNISTLGFKTTCGSQFLKKFEPIYDATVVERLKAAGATVLGKTNLDEFAMGSSCENSSFFSTRNPRDPERVPGGSSGGSAAAVAAREAIAALGSDTGGSIRQPAALCGIVGLKPTYGLVSRYGLVAFASSLDQIGPLAKDVHDAALTLTIIAGRDPHDSTSIDNGDVDYTQGLEEGIRGFKVGLPREYLGEGLSAEAQERIEEWKKILKDLGAELVEFSLPHTEYAIPTYYLISSSEASANLARFDGVRYTSRASDELLEQLYSESRDRGFGAEVKRRIMLGTYALSAGYYEQWYGKAQRVRTLIKQDFDHAFKKVDIIMAPTSPIPAFKLGERLEDPLEMYLSDIYTVPASLAGVPAISLPGGEVAGLPFGLQIIGDKLQEGKILSAAYAFEHALR